MHTRLSGVGALIGCGGGGEGRGSCLSGGLSEKRMPLTLMGDAGGRFNAAICGGGGVGGGGVGGAVEGFMVE